MLTFAHRKKNGTKTLTAKMLMIVKLTIALLLFFTFHISAKGYEQKVTIVRKNVSLSEIFKSIEQQTEFLFFFDKDLIKETKPFDVAIKNATLDEALKICLKDQQLTYTIVSNTIVIQPKIISAQAIQLNNIIALPPPVEIKGRVVNQKGEPLANVSVIVAGTRQGTTTDVNGRFVLAAPDNKGIVLEISIVGFQTKTVKLGKQTEINITLEEDVSGMNEVVVIGYGTARKKDVTGAVSNISAKRLTDKPVVNTGQALQNKIAGVEVISQGGGVPGQNPLIRIRGTNSISAGNDPLYVVDGIVGVANALSTINPSDIASIDVLKDASATAIYGARGANGVIIVTTKRGVNGKTQISINSVVSENTMQRHVYALNAEQLMYLYSQAMNNATKYGSIVASNDFRGITTGSTSYSEMPHLFKQVTAGSYPIPLIGKDGNSYAPKYDTNWEDLMFGNSFNQDHHIDIRGGSENVKFSIALGTTDQQGLMKQSYFKRLTGRITGDIKALKWLTLSTSLAFAKSKATGDDGITRSATEVWSVLPVKYPDDATLGVYAGRWGTNYDFKTGEQWYNVLFRRDQIYSQNNVGQVTGSFTSVAQITKDLTFKSDFSLDFNVYKNNSYSGKLYGGTGSASISQNQTYFWQNENYFNYSKKFGANHMLSAVLGLSWSKNAYQNMSTSNNTFLSNFYGYSNLGAGASARPGSGSGDGDNTLNSYFSRVNYSFKDRYMLTLTGREDGSSRFGKNNKYGFFPSAGVAWRVSQEKFMKNVEVISNLKIRASVGRTGNQEIGSYTTQSFISTTSVILNNSAVTGLYPSSVANPDLKWETTTQKDAGVEIGFFHDRLNIAVDYYHKITSDMLLNVPLPLSTTTGSVRENYGKVQNAGWEFTVNTRNILTTNFKWSTDVTLTSNQNKVLQLGPTGAQIIDQAGAGNGTSVLRVGYPIGSFFGLNRLGTYSTQEASLAFRYGMRPGDLKFQDVNQDGKIDQTTDGNIIGRAFPKYLLGINNTITIKSFDLGVDIQIVQGVSKAFVHESAEDRQLVSGGLNTTLMAWRPDAQNSQVAQLRPGNGGAYYQSFPDTHMMYDASFIRGANATIGYTLSDKLVSRMHLQRVRFYLNAANFFLITKAAGYDPQGSSLDKNISLVPNTDKYQYPTPTVYAFGLNVSL